MLPFNLIDLHRAREQHGTHLLAEAIARELRRRYAANGVLSLGDVDRDLAASAHLCRGALPQMCATAHTPGATSHTCRQAPGTQWRIVPHRHLVRARR